MADKHHFLALDLGAESGRGILVTLDGTTVSMDELHRFPNTPVRLAGTLHWDFPFLFSQVLEAVAACARRGVAPEGISMDTWGVDFGLLGPAGELLANPVNYRDARTENIHDYANRTMTVSEIFAATAYEPWPIASLFQLLAMQRDGSPLLGIAETFLNMPDLFHYFLTRRAVSEMSIANTTNLMGTDGAWCEQIISRFGLPRKLFGELVQPATVLGELSDEAADQTDAPKVPVIATCGHDTSAAVAAVPAEGDHWAFLSCGTWSIFGSPIDRPVATPRCLQLGFTNEYTIGGWYLARNISGLWLVQGLRRKWDRPDKPWDYARMTQEAQAADAPALIDVADDSLMAPADMEEALLALCRKGGGAAPGARGELVRCVLESLALEYNRRLDALGELIGRRPQRVYMVGGGIANTLLCQLTADACGVPVHAGADQCTALGNGLAQALALGILKDPEDIREVMRNSFATTRYTPRDPSAWADKRKRYADLVGA
jgi:rhamnulokinase